MTIQHHLDDATLLAYTTGNLPEAFSLIVASHVSLCDTCRSAAESMDAVGGALLEDVEVAPMGAQSLPRMMELLEDTPAAPLQRFSKGVLPAPLQDYVGGDIDSIRWRPVGMGVKQAILPTSKDASARLLFIPAGAAMPDHSHGGTEMTLVLQGAFRDDEGLFVRGDIEITDENVTHTPIADISEDCICLAVTDAPLQFKGWLPKVVQRIVRI